MTNRTVTPLHNFELDGLPRLQLNALSIVRLTRAQTQDIRTTVGLDYRFNFLDNPEWGAAEVHSNRSTQTRHVDNLVLALRLIKAGSVGYLLQLTYPSQKGQLQTTSLTLGHQLLLGPTFTLKKADLSTLRSLLRNLGDDRLRERYRIAFHRFNQTYELRAVADRLVDTWIALENLYMPDADPREATFRLALRVAYLLGRDAPDRVEIDKQVRSSYRLRSDIVHGRRYKDSLIEPTLDLTIDYLRQTLRTVVRASQEIDIDAVDQAIRSGGSVRVGRKDA